MALIRWEPARELATIQNEMNRLFGTFFDGPPPAGNAGGATLRRWIPAMDLVETENDFVLRADLPGLTEEDGSPDTAHSLNPVPFVVTAGADALSGEGILADVAPTALALLGIEQPPEMTGRSLLAT